MAFWLFTITLTLSSGVWLALRLPVFGGNPSTETLNRMHNSKQFHHGRFENSPPYVSNFSLVDEIRSYLGDQIREPTFALPVVSMSQLDFSKPPLPGMRAWWLGHASALLEIDGVRVLTDPMLSQRASPFQFLGPARLHAVPLPLENWKNIDAVVISHDHFDHLDMATVEHLAKTGTHFYVGLGIGAHLLRWNTAPAQIHEMDWWEQATIKGVTIHCAPARHYSGRTSMNNSTLWASWMIKGAQHSAYFSGDTGYAPHFKAIKEKLGAPQLALIKIGAYGDTWLDIHMNPEDAIAAHLVLGATTLLPIHWATFNLAYHDWKEPIGRAVKAAKAQSVQLVVPKPGEQFEFGQAFTNQEWYLKP